MGRAAVIIYGASIGVHVAFAVGAGSISVATEIESVAVEFTESGKPEEEPEQPDVPEEPKAMTTRPAATHQRVPQKAIETSVPTDSPRVGNDAPDFGLSLSGTGDGPELSVARPGRTSGPSFTQTNLRVAKVQKVLALPTTSDECAEPLIKARPQAVPQPSYSNAARAANVEGKVRVRVHIDESGRVTGVELVSGLGHGLDEAALASARAARFAPATRCGKPVASNFVIAMRFVL